MNRTDDMFIDVHPVSNSVRMTESPDSATQADISLSMARTKGRTTLTI